MTAYLRLAILLGALGALAGALGWAHHLGVKSTTTAWEARWAARDLAEAKVGQDALLAKAAHEAADEQHSAEVAHGYQDALARLAGERDSLADRVRQWAAHGAVQAGSVPGPAAGPPGAAQAAGNRPDGPTVASALAEHLQACDLVTERLRALQALER